MRHGYYIAYTKELKGDPDFAVLAQKYWERFGLTAPGRLDGVSVWGEDEPTIVRIVARDLFSMSSVRFGSAPPFEINKYVTYDVPLGLEH